MLCWVFGMKDEIKFLTNASCRTWVNCHLFRAAQQKSRRLTQAENAGVMHYNGKLIMLELRPNCECCDKDLPPESTEAMICTFECTFCASCAENTLNYICPNCSGNLVPRPIRPVSALKRFPASNKRVLKETGCVKNA